MAMFAAGCYDGDPSGFREAVVVNREGVTALVIDGEQPVLETGASLALTASATTASGTQDFSSYASWRSSNPAAVRVDALGNVTAVGNGMAQVSATLAQFSDTVTITASDAALQAITVSGAGSVNECASASYSATGRYDDGTDRDITALVSWVVADAAIARMSSRSDAKNTLLTRDSGSTGLTAVRGSVASSPFTVTVTDTLDSLVITPAAPAAIARDGSLQFTATGNWGGSSGDVSAAALWALANDDTAASAADLGSVSNGDDSPGLLTAGPRGGTGTLSATCGGQSDAEDITVVYLESLAITNTRPVELAPNATLLLSLEGTWSDAGKEPANENATWSVSTVSGTPLTVSNTTGSRGRITAGNGEGVATVTASLHGKSVSVSVSVVR
jgi:hypothetical protein